MSVTIPAKRAQILEAALGCFGRYGYRRTSMETIARAAGVSRPALYQHFAGREDVFRAMAAWLLDGALERAAAALDAGGPLADRLYGALEVKLALVHGHTTAEFRAELLEEAAAIAGDLVSSFAERLTALVEAALAAAASELDLVGVALPARDAAVLLVDAVTGIEKEHAPPETLRTRLRQLVELAVRGLASQPSDPSRLGSMS
jgi:AcrR family transcriptional regulator